MIVHTLKLIWALRFLLPGSCQEYESHLSVNHQICWPGLIQSLLVGQQLKYLQDGTALPRASFAALARGLAHPPSCHHSTGGGPAHPCWGFTAPLLCMTVMHLHVSPPEQGAAVHTY